MVEGGLLELPLAKNSRAEKIFLEEPQNKSFSVGCRTEAGKGK